MSAAVQHAPATPIEGTGSVPDAVVLIGFHQEEVDVIAQHLLRTGPRPGAGRRGRRTAPSDAPAVELRSVPKHMLSYTVTQVLSVQRRASASGNISASGQDDNGAADNADTGADASGGGGGGADDAAVSAGRVVLLVGSAAQQLGASMNDDLVQWGLAPGIVAAYQADKQRDTPLAQLVSNLRSAHARYYELIQPVELTGSSGAPGVSGGADTGSSSSSSGSDGTDGGTGGALAAAAARHPDDAVIEEARVVLSAVLDAGEVPSILGHYRRDEGHMVVLDGLVTDPERQQILDWLTAPQHNHDGPPPEDKWEMSCVDRAGDQATWGLAPEVLQALRDSPPPAMLALQRRLAALYPEYTICHMPAQQLSDQPSSPEGDDEDDAGETPLSSFVGNAVMPGDPCHWHVDADPSTIPPHSPWVHNFGYYHNREPSRPLFVSLLLYLNSSWPEDYHSETMFMDPEAQLGLFVRPRPGRVVLMDQDVPHRISAPSRQAPGPRYSLVWKLVWVPKDDTRKGVPEDGDGQSQLLSICRPEWGQPVRIGSANAGHGIKAYAARGRP